MSYQSKLMRALQRKVPPVYKHVIKVENFRRFSWKERLQILCGYNLVMMIGIATRHNPGDPVEPRVFCKTSRQLHPDQHMRQVISDMLQPAP